MEKNLEKEKEQRQKILEQDLKQVQVSCWRQINKRNKNFNQLEKKACNKKKKNFVITLLAYLHPDRRACMHS